MTERTSTGYATTVPNARSAPRDARPNFKAHFSDPAGPEFHFGSSSTTSTDITRSQIAELQQREFKQAQQQNITQPDIEEPEHEAEQIEGELGAPDPRGLPQTIDGVNAPSSYDGIPLEDFRIIATMPWLSRAAVLPDAANDFAQLALHAWDGQF